MSLFKEYCTTFERESDILFKQFEIDVSRLDTELTMECTFHELEDSLFEEAETLDIRETSKSKKENKDSKFSKIMKNISDTVTKLITDVIELISNLFSSNSHIDIDSYLQSSTGSIELEYNLKDVRDKVNDEVRKGRKLIQAISKGTGVNDAMIEKYVDNASECVIKHGKVIMTTAQSYAMLNHATGDLDDMKREMKDALRDINRSVRDPYQEIQITKVYRAMRHWISTGTKIYVDVGNQIQKDAIKQQKKQKRKK